jgi:hypothetical protein
MKSNLAARAACGVVLGLTFAWVAGACSSSTSDPPDPTGSCDLLASRCHHYAKDSALANECHELGHTGDDTKCGPRKDECLAACPPFDAAKPDVDVPDAPADAAAGDSSDAPVDSGPDVCPDYCKCLNDTCSAVTGYPFASVDQCLAACKQMTDPQKKCWPGFCAQASAGGSTKNHNCEHAWGLYDLDECP